MQYLVLFFAIVPLVIFGVIPLFGFYLIIKGAFRLKTDRLAAMKDIWWGVGFGALFIAIQVIAIILAPSIIGTGKIT